MTSPDSQPAKPSLPASLQAFAASFDPWFEDLLKPPDDAPGELIEAVRYSALAPGKRLRPYLVVRCCEVVGGAPDSARPVAAAVECIHAFSLIHDDLPAMDDDDLRRGRPTCHKKFGEAVAILAGDALVTLAFELIGRHATDAPTAANMMLELARGAGWSGMIGGQAADVLGESAPPSPARATYIHERKTACLFATACRLGAMAGKAAKPEVECLARYGRDLGRAFQITDDLLDVTSTKQQMGKAVGKDSAANKQTFPRCVGVEESRRIAAQAVEQAIGELETFGSATDDLRVLARYVIDRNY